MSSTTREVASNVYLEILSMLSPSIRLEMKRAIELARDQAKAELAEKDLSGDAQKLMEFNLECAELALAYLKAAQAEVDELTAPVYKIDHTRTRSFP